MNNDEETLLILREIRDLQKLNIENYKEAIAFQRAAVADQKKSRSSILTLALLLVALSFSLLVLFR